MPKSASREHFLGHSGELVLILLGLRFGAIELLLGLLLDLLIVVSLCKLNHLLEASYRLVVLGVFYKGLTHQETCLDCTGSEGIFTFQLKCLLAELDAAGVLHLFKINHSKVCQIVLLELCKFFNRFFKFIGSVIFFDVIALGILALEEIVNADVHLGCLVEHLIAEEAIRNFFEELDALHSLDSR